MEFHLLTRQDDALAHIGGIAHGDGVALSQVIEPGVHISSSQVVLNLIVAVSLTRGADKIHHMIAIGGFHDAGVTSLAVSIEAPVVECINHLAGIDILVQAAIGVGTGISGVGVGQLGKAFLGCIAGLPLIQQVLGLFAGSFFCSVGVGAVLGSCRHRS